MPTTATTLQNGRRRRFTWRDKLVAWLFGRVRCAECNEWAEVERGPLCIFTNCLLLTCHRCNLGDLVDGGAVSGRDVLWRCAVVIVAAGALLVALHVWAGF